MRKVRDRHHSYGSCGTFQCVDSPANVMEGRRVCGIATQLHESVGDRGQVVFGFDAIDIQELRIKRRMVARVHELAAFLSASQYCATIFSNSAGSNGFVM